MKRIVFLFLLLSASAFACVCVANIILAFTQTQQFVTQRLNYQENQLKTLTDAVNQSTQKIQEQNKILKQQTAVLKEKTLDKEHLIFLLMQKIELKG